MTYCAPIDSIRFSLETIGDLDNDMTAGLTGDLSPELLGGILDEAARFAETELAPQNLPGDRQGARFLSGEVTLPEDWPRIYRAWAEAGWNGVDLSAEWGGMGLPTRLATATMELWTSACMSFALGPVLTQGAVDTLETHADPALREHYLGKLVSGEWTATMNLTEPQAGSDLGLLRTRAEPSADGSYRLFGNKIFITYGEHDLTENIVHLVLARLPDAPLGTKGISLFLVPKVLVGSDGSPGARNDVTCTGIEHKLGIHGSPTCSMSFGDKTGAVGFLVGEPHRGLACMFTMMNKARLFTGLQGVAIAERAYQQALAFAKIRRQGRAARGASAPSPIIAHPDVRRNLLTMRALVAAGRAIAHQAASAIDRAHALTDPGARAKAEERAALLTPITKAWCTDMGCEVASLGVQIHGGMGYIEETGVAQHFRDARIAPIYEGTNGIQAIDLALRKVLRPGSMLAEEMIAEFDALGDAAGALPGAGGQRTREAATALSRATAHLRGLPRDGEAILFAATPYLKLFGMAAATAFLTKGALAAIKRRRAGDRSPVLDEAMANARFFAENIAVAAPALAEIVTTGRLFESDCLDCG